MSAEPTPLRGEDSPHTPLLSDDDRRRLVNEALGDGRIICRQCGSTLGLYDPAVCVSLNGNVMKCQGSRAIDRAAYPVGLMAKPNDNIVPFPGERTIPDPPKRWRAFEVSSITAEPPPPQWIWDGLIARGAVTLLGGIMKVGKTRLLQQILSAAAANVPALGRHMERCRSFGFFTEDPQDWLIHQQYQIAKSQGLEPSDYDNFAWVSRADAGADCVLADFSNYGRMTLTSEWRNLWGEVDRLGTDIVGIDTAAAVFGGNDTRRNHVTPFVRALQKEAIQRQIAVILAIHPPVGNAGKGYAGSGAWHASARGGLSLERPQDYDEYTGTPPDERVLRDLGGNWGQRNSVIKCRYDEGAFSPEPDVPIPHHKTDPAYMDILAKELLLGLYRTRTDNGKVPADETRIGSLTYRYRKWIDASKPCNHIYTARERLLQRGEIIRVNVNGDCLLRPADGRPYQDETKWQV